MLLYHYYEKKNGPFRSISELSDAQAEEVLERIRSEKPDAFISKRPEDYVQKRRRFEKILLEEFRKKGGLIERETPHYLVVEACPFFENGTSRPPASRLTRRTWMCVRCPLPTAIRTRPSAET